MNLQPRTLLRSHCQVRVESQAAGPLSHFRYLRVLEVSRAGFYYWRQRPPSQRQQEDERLKVAIRAAHSKTRQTYGAVRLQAELAAEGFFAGRDRIG